MLACVCWVLITLGVHTAAHICSQWSLLLCHSLKLMSAMFKKLHLAYDKVVDVMVTRKRYLATYYKVVFFGKVSTVCLCPHRLHQSLQLWIGVYIFKTHTQLL